MSRKAEMDRKRVRVLVIEDSEADYLHAQRLLRKSSSCRFDLVWEASFAEGIGRLAEEKEDIDVILLDLALPDAAGWETFKKVQQVAANTPVIVFTGYSDEEMAIHAVQEGAQDYLLKNKVDGRSLSRAVLHAIERKSSQTRLRKYADELRDRNAELRDELDMAREIQQALLPQEYPAFNALERGRSVLRFSHLYYPSMAVGGDFFDIREVSKSEAGLFLCDVMGHGLRAALITAIIRGELEEMSAFAVDPGAFLTKINHELNAVFKHTHHVVFASALYMVVDVLSANMKFANAGHTSPLHISREKGTINALAKNQEIKGAALGLFPDSAYECCECQLGGDELVFLFTDGLFDTGGDLLNNRGQEPLQQALKQRLHLSTNDMFTGLLKELKGNDEGLEYDDDVCMLGVECSPGL